MPIHISCFCGREMEVDDALAGHFTKCPMCRRQLIIPIPEELESDDEFEGSEDEPSNSRKARTSLILGLASIVGSVTVVLGLLLGIPAIIYGSLGLGEIGRGMGRLRGKGMAITGIVTGALSCSLIPIVVTIALLLPAVQTAREPARRGQCENNLKLIGLALRNYHDTEGQFPMAAITDAEGKPLLSWRVAILPYIGKQSLYEKFHLNEPWDSSNNTSLLAQMPPIYACPSDVNSDSKTSTHYKVIVGPGALFESGKTVQDQDVMDETSNTLMIAEAATPVPWTQPLEFYFMPGEPLPAMGSRHPDGFHAVFADGTVKFLKNSTHPQTLEGYITRNGGENRKDHNGP